MVLQAARGNRLRVVQPGMIDRAFSPISEIQTWDALIAVPVEIGANGREPVNLMKP
jgi:hypothetical protein